ncbi:MAG: DNA primase, partial [Candidatus Poribacteria bacterium]|nr:DNA primase [Candidatus Poribacteria bacterium]
MLKLGRDELTKYPFMPDAGRYLQEYGFELSQFGEDPTLRIISKRAFERVMVSTRGEIYKPELVHGTASLGHTLDVEILSFLIAIVLIKLTNRHTLVRRFALSEARRAESYLAGDLSDRRDRSRAGMARRILYDLFGLKVGVSDYRYLIPVPDYLQHSSVFHEREWKLVNRQVEDGHVILKPDKTVRLIRHALTTYISDKIRDSPVPDMIPGLEGMVAELAAVADRLTPTYESTGENPPCIKHAINVLKSGEN